MNVKCPKCRFRFEFNASPGMNEVQCNCPRCGVPFTYVVGGETGVSDNVGPQKKLSSEKASVSVSFQDEAPHPERRTESSVYSHPSSTVTPPSVSAPHPTSSEPALFLDPRKIPGAPPPPLRNPKSSCGCGCLKGCAATITGLFLFFAFLIHQCGSSESYTADDLENTEDSENRAYSGILPDEIPAFNKHLRAEQPPSWIQGRWHVDTDYGGITVVIHEDRITEISGGQRCHGSFKYQTPFLYCVFGRKNEFVYRLIEDRRQIDAGAGLLMKKTE